MGISLKRLEQKKLQVGISKLAGAGIDVERWLAMCDAGASEMARLAKVWPVFRPSFSYIAATILGLSEESRDPLPEPAPGEVVIRVGAWSLQDLCACETVRDSNLMCVQDWYYKYPWSRAKLVPGVYRVRMPVPESNCKNFAGQKKLLLPGEEVTPVALAATVLLCHLKQTGKDLLENDWTHCAEALPDGYRVALDLHDGPVFVLSLEDGNNSGNDYVWMSAARKC